VGRRASLKRKSAANPREIGGKILFCQRSFTHRSELAHQRLLRLMIGKITDSPLREKTPGPDAQAEVSKKSMP
jgi:hypothetical protein